ncbi:nuclear transport factor 2 family protein [Bacillus atrophaeus]|uniref:nuclear transport factor 2 family protein n=1 Tax=Bacillus atrophaeus TaxID=1452 RepID=UPI0022810A11|nr:nuclear transport factor 2 family protein [Bacillus atrophaeus]MCY8491027.1 nuclear transport factor 2 family protein [Bacillus atrophaeus]
MMIKEYDMALETLKQFLQYMLEKDMERWIELWDDDAVLEFPYAPGNYPKRIEGKSAIYDYIKDFPEKIDISSFTSPTVYRSADTNTMIAEFQCEGRVIATGLPYHQTYISVIETKDGNITHYKDYWNPLAGNESFGGSMEAFLESEGAVE